MSDILYRKVGRRYQPVGIEWHGWPANGWWLCKDGRNALIEPIDSPNPLQRIRVKQYQEEVLKRALDRYHQSGRQASFHEMASWTLAALADVLSEQGKI